ncbi:MAG: TolC family protein, partial [Azospira sp.]|nr:TolC family protein [Azospira sp.]
VSRRALELASRQTRANPEIAISTRRDRSAAGEMTDQTWALALRLPFSSTPRNQARIAEANADLIEAETQLRLERQRLAQEGETARAQLDAARLQLAAAETRARLAAENRGFYDKAFRLGEADLPTRLRIELEAFEAERQAVRSRIQAAAALSQLRQALGLLPE